MRLPDAPETELTVDELDALLLALNDTVASTIEDRATRLLAPLTRRFLDSGDPAVFDRVGRWWTDDALPLIEAAIERAIDIGGDAYDHGVLLAAVPPDIRRFIVAQSVQRMARIFGDPATTIAAAEMAAKGQNRKLRAALQKQFGLTKPQIELVVRTELMAARAQTTRLMAERASDQPVEHVWIAVMDENTRPEHAAAHEQVQPFEEPFNVGGYEMMHPLAMNAPADLVINCRCVEVLLYPGDRRPDGSQVPEAVVGTGDVI